MEYKYMICWIDHRFRTNQFTLLKKSSGNPYLKILDFLDFYYGCPMKKKKSFFLHFLQ